MINHHAKLTKYSNLSVFMWQNRKVLDRIVVLVNLLVPVGKHWNWENERNNIRRIQTNWPPSDQIGLQIRGGQSLGGGVNHLDMSWYACRHFTSYMRRGPLTNLRFWAKLCLKNIMFGWMRAARFACQIRWFCKNHFSWVVPDTFVIFAIFLI